MNNIIKSINKASYDNLSLKSVDNRNITLCLCLYCAHKLHTNFTSYNEPG